METNVLQMPSIAEFEQMARSHRLVGYFGYGSLVNRGTLTTRIAAAWPARLKGWRRTWRARPEIGLLAPPAPLTALSHGPSPCLLSAHPESGASIDGLLVIDFAENLPAVDAREFRYHRRDLHLRDLEFATASGLSPHMEIALHVYEARVEHPPVEGPSPILRSYLDTVMQGFYREFGPDGVHRFIAETGAFHMPIHEDRHAPLYPRAVRLSPEEIALFDHALRLGPRDPGN